MGLLRLPECERNCELIRGEIDHFRVNVPLLVAMRSPAMRPRHWKKLSTELDMEIDPNDVRPSDVDSRAGEVDSRAGE
eukprot:5910489-Pyramimonas_sp.AAC.1